MRGGILQRRVLVWHYLFVKEYFFIEGGECADWYWAVSHAALL
jgi:hypothetical protein